MTTRIWVDFNSLDDDGLYPTLRKFASSSVSIGDAVIAFDHDGNEADGTVAYIHGDVVRVQLDLATFVSDRHLTETAQ